MASVPPYPPHDVINSLALWDRALREHEIIPIYVLDGCKHPIQSNIHQLRAKERLEAEKALNDFYQRGKNPDNCITDDGMEEAMKYIKIIATLNNH